MKCVVCKSEMPQRNGKFGTFYFCKLGHGTASVQGSKLFVTGAIFTKIAEARKGIEGMEMEMPDIEVAVSRGMASMGFFMNDMDRFIEGGREAAQDEEDHWMNGRLY
jgi:hypothetical protein